jgi:hypothetical protein
MLLLRALFVVYDQPGHRLSALHVLPDVAQEDLSG